MWMVWLAMMASAKTIEVGPTGVALREALLLAKPGDVVQIAPGSYGADALSVPPGVTVVGAGAADTVIRHESFFTNTTVLAVQQARDVVLQDLTISGEGAARPLLVEIAGVTLRGVVLRDGPDSIDVGALLYARLSDVTLVGAELDGTRSVVEQLGGLAFVEASVLTIEGGHFHDGTSTSDGAGIFAEASEVVVTGATFEDNVSETGGGGALLFKGNPSDGLTIDGAQFLGNRIRSTLRNTDRVGGAVHAVGGVVRIERAHFEGNAAGFGGGALAVSFASDALLADNTFRDNDATQGGSIAVYSSRQARMHRNDIRGGGATNLGGAVYVLGDGSFELRGNRICDTSSLSGGAIAVHGGSEGLDGEIRNNLVLRTSATTGASLLAWDESRLTVINNVFHEGISEQGSVRVGTGAQLQLINNVLSGHLVAVWDEASGVSAAYNAYHDNAEDFGGVATDAQPIAVGDLALGMADCDAPYLPNVGSPLVDTGDPTMDDDDGTRSDVGAHGGPGASSFFDVDGDGVVQDDCAPFDPLRTGPEDEVVADGLDQDCDGLDLCYVDGDGDGVGSDLVGAAVCTDAGWAATTGDCDDADPSRAADCSPAVVDGPQQAPSGWFCGVGPTGGGAAPVWLASMLLLVRRERS
ncbi:MAG: right-handed parallel beta-helix repeat-containing protein [Myxococcales bacterium]|nr:right-handed parallel beta-helix repeat-containing protein [Myxococcales bacterium]